MIEKELTWRSYTTTEALPTTKRIEIINKKELAKVVLDEKSETFVVYMAFLNLVPEIYPDKAAQIVFLLAKKVRIPDEYSNFANVFLEKKALVLLKRTELNDHAIDLKNSKQPAYGPIVGITTVV